MFARERYICNFCHFACNIGKIYGVLNKILLKYAVQKVGICAFVLYNIIGNVWFAVAARNTYRKF